MNVIENNAASLMRNVYVHQTIISRQIQTSLEPKETELLLQIKVLLKSHN